MNRLITIVFLFAFLANTAAQTNRVVFSFDHKVGANPLILNQTEFSIWNGKKVILTRAEFYLAKLSASKTYTDQFIRAFDNAAVTPDKIGLALEQFMLSMVSYNAKLTSSAAKK